VDIKESGYLFFTVILFKVLKSIQGHNPPSFLGTKKKPAETGCGWLDQTLKASLMSPRSKGISSHVCDVPFLEVPVLNPVLHFCLSYGPGSNKVKPCDTLSHQFMEKEESATGSKPILPAGSPPSPGRSRRESTNENQPGPSTFPP